MTFDYEMQRRLDRVVGELIEALADDPGLRHTPRNVPVDGFGAGYVNGRKAVGRIIRCALRERLVYANQRQAEFLSLSGSVGHDDTPADLLPESEAAS